MAGNKQDARTEYSDIIDRPRWESPVHPHMSLYDRAAQFMPFAALTGYDDMIAKETERVNAKDEYERDRTEY